ncbi:TonB family protein [candidate division WOR-3 bacterium]|uniref:TonB family protein n=1 Tax=candidate division WOR-3 bacterium TaxID=2052148 RepID=A0A9D5QCK7_UNCW3|nr:TonB family protein [candidate division WOR-3 bacterium]MBD3364664.1 TonB family protein [candidate division WOR-3 bacterium]
MDKKPVADLKRSYPIYLRLGFIGAILINIGLFALMPKGYAVKPYKATVAQTTELDNIEMKAEDLTPPPPKEEEAAMPEEAESEEEIEATTIAKTEFAEVYAPVEEKVDIPVVDFFKVEKKPEPIKQFEPEYPRDARESKASGTVFVNALVGPNGRVLDVKLAQSSGYPSLDNAALKAARNWVFSPGEQRGQPVKVWVNIPFTFKL